MKSTFEDFVKMAGDFNKKGPEEISCDVPLKVEGHNLKAHSVSISQKDLMFYTKNGTVSYVVDTYGGEHVAELFDWDLSDECFDY